MESKYLRSLKIAAIYDCLDTVYFLDRKIRRRQLDTQIKRMAAEDRYAKHLMMTIPVI